MNNQQHLLTAQQQLILKLLKQGDRYRFELLPAAEDSYAVLKRLLDPLMAQKFVEYKFAEDDSQIFFITQAGREALDPSPVPFWLPKK